MFNAQDVADKVGIGNSTVRLWARQFEIPRERKGTKWVYSDEAMDIFKAIKSMRENEHGMDTIRRTISKDVTVPSSSHELVSVQAVSDNRKEDLLDDIEKVMERALAKNNELSEKYARATYTIGQQDERIRALEETVQKQVRKIEGLNEEIKLLPEPTELEPEIDTAAQEELNELKAKLEILEEENSQLKASVWSKFKRFFK